MANKEIRTGSVQKENGQVETHVLAYSAPLPPASEFEKYESVLPGAADRIIKLAENQNKHRRFIENVVVVSDSLRSLGGLISALIIVLLGIVAGTYLIMHGKSTQGLIALFGPLAIAAGAFHFQKQKENLEKDSRKK